MKHRKLFPSITAQNQTTDCRNYLCDPVLCPSYCYSSFPPPLPQLPLRPPPQETGISNSTIFVISSLAISFLLFCYYSIVAKCSNGMQPPAEAANAEQAEEGLDQNRVDHPIWFITTTGLQQSVINSIAVFKYEKGKGLIEGTDCSVCLSEFQEDERLRLLPNCVHAFHISCIDTWLTTHTNCPLCRAPIVHDDPVIRPPPPPPPAVSRNPDSLESIARTQMENSEINGGGLSNNHGERNEDCGNRGETEEVTSEETKKRSLHGSETAAALCFDLHNGSPLQSEMGSYPANVLESRQGQRV